jgi:hypothetical protein
VHNYLSLYTIAKGITKTSIFKELLMTWVDERKKEESDMALVQQIIRRTHMQWVKQRQRGITLMVFKAELRQELENRGISYEYIDLILRDLL